MTHFYDRFFIRQGIVPHPIEHNHSQPGETSGKSRGAAGGASRT